MLIVLYLLAVVVVLFVAAVVATRDGDVLAPAPPDHADLDLPDGPMQPEDVAEVRFGLTVRGYRMQEVDDVLARLAGELGARDRRIIQLEHALVAAVEPRPEESDGGWADASGAPTTPPAVTLAKTEAAPVPPDSVPPEVEVPEVEVPEVEVPEVEVPEATGYEVDRPEAEVVRDEPDLLQTSAVAHDERGVHAPVATPPLDDDFPEVPLPEAASPGLPEAADQDDVDPLPLDTSAGQPGSAAEVDAPTEEPTPDGGDDAVDGPPPALGPPGEGTAPPYSEDSGGGRPPWV